MDMRSSKLPVLPMLRPCLLLGLPWLSAMLNEASWGLSGVSERSGELRSGLTGLCEGLIRLPELCEGLPAGL